MGQRQGITVEAGDGNIRTIVFGWGAAALGIGITVSAIILSSALGLAITILSSCAGVALICVGAGEGVRRARLGRAAEIAARAQLEASPWKELPR